MSPPKIVLMILKVYHVVGLYLCSEVYTLLFYESVYEKFTSTFLFS